MFSKEDFEMFEKDTELATDERYVDANGVPWASLKGYISTATGSAKLHLEDMSGTLKGPEGLVDVRWDVNDMTNNRFTILPTLELAEKVLLVTMALQFKEEQ